MALKECLLAVDVGVFVERLAQIQKYIAMTQK